VNFSSSSKVYSEGLQRLLLVGEMMEVLVLGMLECALVLC
jgi:hypothetical protein